MTTPTSDTALASELRATIFRLGRRLRSQRTDESMSIGRLATLGTLERHGPLTPGELAAHERVQPPSMTRMLVALEELELVTRTDHPTDRRQVLVALSDKGRALLKEDRKRRDAWLATRMRELDPADLAVLRQAADVLKRIADS
jgi:DNA-binding MarR family transcriptional regulator